MPIIVRSQTFTVVAISAPPAYLRAADGSLRLLKIGDVVQKGDQIVTTQDGIVELSEGVSAATAQAARPAAATGTAATEADAVIQALDRDDPTAATAAGVGAGEAGDLQPGLRVDRIAEATTPAGIRTNGIDGGSDRLQGNTTAPEEQNPLPPVIARSTAIAAIEEGAPVNLGLGGGAGVTATATITVDQVPSIGQVLRPDGSVVLPGASLSPADLDGLSYQPPADYDGTAPVGSFVYTVVSNGATSTGTTTIQVTPINDAPVATGGNVTGPEDVNLQVSLLGEDRDGQVTLVTVTGLPPGSTLLLADGVTPVAVGQTLTPDQATNLIFRPAPDFNGTAVISYTVTDNEGSVSAPGDMRVTLTAVNDAPIARPDLATVAENTPASGNVLGNDLDIDGPSLAVIQFTVNGNSFAPGTQVDLPGVGTVVVAGDGSYSFTPVAGFTGDVPVLGYTVSDGSLSATSTLSLNVTPALRPEISISDVTVNEAAGTAVFVVSLSAPTTGTVTVDFSTADGTATAGADYLPTAGRLVFAPGVTSQTITVSILDDVVFEGSETFSINLSAPATATIADAQGLGTIRDDGTGTGGSNDDRPQVATVSSPSTAEGGNLDFAIALTAPSTTPTTVTITATSGSAVLGTDTGALQVSFDGGVSFVPIVGGTVTVPAGNTGFIVRVPAVDDSISEPTEQFTLTVATSVNATPVTGTGSIVDNDNAPTISTITSPTVVEGTDLVYAVTLSNPSSTPTSFPFTLGGGSAAPADYGTPTFSDGVTLVGGNLIVPAGVTSFSVTLPTVQDTLNEPAESVPLNIGGVTATGTITDNDPIPTLAIDDVSVNEAAGTATFTVTLSAASGQPVSVNYATANGTATAGQDYTATSGTLNFAAGQTTQTITVAITNDLVFEGSETFSVDLSAPVNATIADPLGIGSIVDNDAAPTISTITSPTVVEGTDLVYAVTLSNPSATPASFAYALGGGSAIPIDYGTPTFSDGVTLVGGNLIVPAGVTSFSVTLPTVQDTLNEPAESVPLSIGGVNATGTITDNDLVPALVINDVSVNKADGSATFTVTLSAASGQAVSVNYATANGTATAGQDYTATSGTLNFAPGQTTQTITVAITNDLVFEGTETFNVNLSAPVNATIADEQGLGTIVDNGTAPTISTITSPTVVEGGDLVYAVTLSNPSATPTSFAFALGGGSAVPTDYGTPTFSDGVTLVGGNLIVPAGVTSFSVTLPTVQDTLSEPTETVPLTVGGTRANGTITDNDPVPTLAINDISVNEADGSATFTVTLSAASGQPVSVNYATANGTATAGQDYTATSGTLNFAAGQTTQTITVTITNDLVFEGAETFNINLSAPVNATIADAQGLGSIVDNDAAPTISTITSPTVVEGTDLVYAVTLSNPSATPTSFPFTLGGGSAAPTDYGTPTFSNGVTLLNGVLTVPAGVTSFSVNLPTVQDTLNEPTETVPLSLGGVTATGTITDNDPIPTLAIDDVSVNEAAGTATFTVTLSAASGQAVSVNYATANGTATAGQDYTATSGTLNFAAGQTTQTITVAITNDLVFEGAETFSVNLTAPVNATIADAQGLGTIVDNDAAPTISTITSPTVVEGTDLVYAVTLSNPSATPTSFPFTLGGGSAAPTDYGTPTLTNGVTLVAGNLIVPAGVTSFSVTLPTVQDTLNEPTETVPLSLGGVTATGTITDNDPVPTLAINDVSVNEAAGTATFTVTLSAASGQAISVNYATANGTATAGQDYTATSGTLNFAAGQTTQTITVTITNDLVFEGAETFSVNLTAPVNATIADAQGLGTIVDNDAAPTISTITSPTVVEGTDLVYAVTLSNPSATPTSFPFTLGGGSAAPTDYGTPTFSNGVTLLNGVLIVPAGVTSFSVTLPTVQDTLNEPTETVPLSLGGVTATGTITDNDPIPTLAIDDVSVNEAAGTATFTVTLSAASGQAVSVNYATANGTATAGQDYTADQRHAELRCAARPRKPSRWRSPTIWCLKAQRPSASI